MRSLAVLFVRFFLLAAFFAAPAGAEELRQNDRAEIQSIIDRQIAAFRRDDGAEAFSYAAPELQTHFGSADTFMRMVQAGYGPVYRPQFYEFRDLKTSAGVVTQHVHIVGPDKVARLALYFMQRQADGSWRIAGCVLVDYEGDQV